MGCVSSKRFRRQAGFNRDAPASHDWEETKPCEVLGMGNSYREDSFFEFHGFLDMDRSSYQDALLSVNHRRNHYQGTEECGTFDFVFASVHEMKQMLLSNKDGLKYDSLRNESILQQQHHYDEVDQEEMEIINTWELMEGLEDLSRTPSPLRDYGNGKQERTSSPLRGYKGGKLSIPERNILLNAQDMSSGDFESPVWKKYYAQEGAAKYTPFGDITTSPFNDSPRKLSGDALFTGLDDSASVSSGEPFNGGSTVGLKLLLNSTNSSPCYLSPLEKRQASSFNHQPSPTDKRASYQSENAMFDSDAKHLYTEYSEAVSSCGSQAGSPCKTPNASIVNRQQIYGSSSPLFDPALMVTFEQALHATMDVDCKPGWIQSNIDECFAPDSSNVWESINTASISDKPLKAYKGGDNYAASKITSMDKEDGSGIKTSLDSYLERCPPRGNAKVVLYFTSLRGVRKTHEECCYLRLILRGLRVQVDERDVWMHAKFKEELFDLIGNDLNGSTSFVPQLFINGRYIGGADVVKHLHEEGILAKLIDGFAKNAIQNICRGCGDARFIPCLVCNGSCKVVKQYEVSRCWECNENGLIMCPVCVD